MKRSRIALAILLGTAVLATVVSVGHFSAKDAKPVPANIQQKASADKTPRAAHHFPMSASVKNVTKTSEEANRITLSWDKTEGATGYYVYVCDKDAGGNYVLFSESAEPGADLMNLKDTNAYWIKVTAYRESDGMIYESPATVMKTATQPADVSSLDSLRSSEVLKFCWPSGEGNIEGYDVYRADKDTKSKYVLYQTLAADAHDFEDTAVSEGNFYSYKLCPYRTIDGVKYSAKGKTIDFISGLSAPGNLIARSANTRVTLYWSGKELADGYNIYMSTSEKSGFKKLGSTEDNSYSTDKLEAGKTYYFRVQPYKTMDDGKDALGTWSTCSVKASDTKDSASGTPKSTIQGSGTYIEISIAQQHMWFYEKGKLLVDTDVVTGNRGNNDTPTGSYTLESRARDTTLTGEGYSSFVNYWMGFYGGYGIHDASWRSSYGGDIYEGNGSHGCVNTPYEKVKKIYEHTDYGTPVYIY